MSAAVADMWEHSSMSMPSTAAMGSRPLLLPTTEAPLCSGPGAAASGLLLDCRAVLPSAPGLSEAASSGGERSGWACPAGLLSASSDRWPDASSCVEDDALLLVLLALLSLSCCPACSHTLRVHWHPHTRVYHQQCIFEWHAQAQGTVMSYCKPLTCHGLAMQPSGSQGVANRWPTSLSRIAVKDLIWERGGRRSSIFCMAILHGWQCFGLLRPSLRLSTLGLHSWL